MRKLHQGGNYKRKEIYEEKTIQRENYTEIYEETIIWEKNYIKKKLHKEETI